MSTDDKFIIIIELRRQNSMFLEHESFYHLNDEMHALSSPIFALKT